MNDYDEAAFDTIEQYHKKYGKYPERVEATALYREEMSCTYFECEEPLQDRNVRVTRIPVAPLGTGDIVYRSILVRNHDINLEQAKCKTVEEFQRVGAKLARAGLVIVEPKSSWGLQTYNPHLFFSQIEAWVFGEEATFDGAVTEETNHLPGD